MSRQSPWKLIGLAICGIFIGVVLFNWEAEIPLPSGWPMEFKRYRNVITGEVRVVDSVHHRALFFYDPDSGVYPVAFKQTANNKWEVEFEESSNK
jgi:hypothetical protein